MIKGYLIEMILTLILGILVIAVFWLLMPGLSQEIPTDAFKI
jgi:hypothetical protein